VPTLSSLYLHVSPELIAFLKFILEGYDGLAVLSTVDHQGKRMLVLKYHSGCYRELVGLLDNLPALNLAHGL